MKGEKRESGGEGKVCFNGFGGMDASAGRK